MENWERQNTDLGDINHILQESLDDLRCVLL